MYIKQFEHHFDFSRNAILRPATARPGNAGAMLSLIYKSRPQHIKVLTLSHADPDRPYIHHALKRRLNDRAEFYSFVWRKRKYSIAVHSDRTALVFSTTKDGFGMQIIPIVFEIPFEICIPGDRKYPLPNLRLTTDFHNHLNARRTGQDWNRPGFPILVNTRSNVRPEDFDDRNLFRRRLIQEIKSLWLNIEKQSLAIMPTTPWWADAEAPTNHYRDWLESLIRDAVRYYRAATGIEKPIQFMLRGRTITAQGDLTSPTIALKVINREILSPKELAWVCEALDLENCPVPWQHQIVQEHGNFGNLANKQFMFEANTLSAHEVIEALSIPDQYATRKKEIA